jgi:lysine 2,3-aminomutase
MVSHEKSISTIQALSQYFDLNSEKLKPVVDKYPMRIHPYVLGLMSQKNNAPVANQFIPQIDELADRFGDDDPLAEKQQSPVSQVVHRYPDRVVFLISNTCPSFCRFCMRKRFIGKQPQVSQSSIDIGLSYIARTKAIREVILSGGEPFMHSDTGLFEILDQLRQISHVKIIRMHSRIPILMPHRITLDLVKHLRKYHPIYINIHVNHANEISSESQKVIQNFADAGFPLGSQTVLLKGINDNPDTMLELMQALLTMRVRPYYIHQMDDTQGTSHFQTNIDTGIQIMAYLRGRISGMGVPQYMIDLPKGGGKIPLLPNYILDRTDTSWKFRNFEGKSYEWKYLRNARKISSPFIEVPNLKI